MECEAALDLLIDEMADNQDLPAAAADHLASCAACTQAAVQLRTLWHELGTLEIPRPDGKQQERAWRALAAAATKAAPAEATTAPPMRAARPRAATPRWLLAAAGVAGMALGAGVERALQARPGAAASASASAPMGTSRAQEPRFLLLLHKGADSTSNLPAADRLRVVNEYRAWARDLARAHRLLMADELAQDAGRWLSPSGLFASATGADGPASPQWISGYFIIAAPDYATATAIASQCPHLKYGGTIEVRAVRQEGQS